MARGSALEVGTQLEIASMQGFGNPENLRNAQAIVSEIVKMLDASLATMRMKQNKPL